MATKKPADNSIKAAREWARLIEELRASSNSGVKGSAATVQKLLENASLISDDKERIQLVLALTKLRTQIREDEKRYEAEMSGLSKPTGKAPGSNATEAEKAAYKQEQIAYETAKRFIEEKYSQASRKVAGLESAFRIEAERSKAQVVKDFEARIKALNSNVVKGQGFREFKTQLLTGLAAANQGNLGEAADIMDTLALINEPMAESISKITGKPRLGERFKDYLDAKKRDITRSFDKSKAIIRNLADPRNAIKAGAKGIYSGVKNFATEKLRPSRVGQMLLQKEEAFRKGVMRLFSQQVNVIRSLPSKLDSAKGMGIAALLASVLAGLPSWDEIRDKIMQSDFMKNVNSIWEWLKEGWKDLTSPFKIGWEWMKEKVGAAVDWTKDAFSYLYGKGRESWSTLMDWGSKAVNVVLDIKDWIVDKFTSIMDSIKNSWLGKKLGLDSMTTERAIGMTPPGLTFRAARNAFSTAPSVPAENQDRMDRLNKSSSKGWLTRSWDAVSNSAVGSAVGSVKDAIGKWLLLRNSADLANMDPSTRDRFLAMAQEYNQITGKTLSVNSGFRTREEQTRLYRANPNKAAPPGTSLHEKGFAIDIDSGAANDLSRMGLMNKYGFERPHANEAWHLQTVGAKEEAARRGYSNGDGPPNTKPSQLEGSFSPSGAISSPEEATSTNQTSSSSREKSNSSPPQSSMSSIPFHSYNDPMFHAMNLEVVTP